jgi:hypothetical protein
MRRAETLTDVIQIIDEIVRHAIATQDRIGYFAALYHHVAVAFQRAVQTGKFTDPVRMEKLDVVFFNRYLSALEEWQSDQRCSRCWQVAFDATPKDGPTVVQHLLLGMNAHIDFDLGIAVADAVPAADLSGFEADFDRMNALLASLLDDVLRDLTKIWPLLGPINRWLGKADDAFIAFSMREAREIAWDHALRLSKLDPAARAEEIRSMDFWVASLGEILWHPPFPMNMVVFLVHAGERGDVSQRIRWLLEEKRRRRTVRKMGL